MLNRSCWLRHCGILSQPIRSTLKRLVTGDGSQLEVSLDDQVSLTRYLGLCTMDSDSKGMLVMRLPHLASIRRIKSNPLTSFFPPFRLCMHRNNPLFPTLKSPPIYRTITLPSSLPASPLSRSVNTSSLHADPDQYPYPRIRSFLMKHREMKKQTHSLMNSDPPISPSPLQKPNQKTSLTTKLRSTPRLRSSCRLKSSPHLPTAEPPD